MKIQFKLILALGIILVVSLAAAVYGTVMGKPSTPLLTINDVPIDDREFMLFVNIQRSNVFGYFKDKYGASDHPDFWNTTYSGETPIEMAKQLALEQLKAMKVQQLLAKENGLLSDVSYATFLSQLSQENTRRQKAVQNKQVIYGPVQYEEWGYYNYLWSNLVNNLKQKLSEKDAKMTEQEAGISYESLKDRLYKKEGGYRSIEEVKDDLAIRFADDRYVRKVEQLIQQAVVVINDDAYNAIK